MRLDEKAKHEWLATVNTALPGLLDAVARASGKVLVMGAAVMQFYRGQKWVLGDRATGDLDLSMGVLTDVQEYSRIRDLLLKLGYTAEDSDRKYRLYSPVKVVLDYSYVDLLAHPEGDVAEAAILDVMGVGQDWSFDAIQYALSDAFDVAQQLFVPNFIGFLALKRASYCDNPTRVRDLVDLVDIIDGSVKQGLQHDLAPLLSSMGEKNADITAKVVDMIKGFVQEQVAWNLLPAEHEFEARGYNFKEIDEQFKGTCEEFLEGLGVSI